MKLAALASSSHGVVTRQRLLAAGCSHDEIRWRVRNGTLIRVHPGVYRVGHAARSVEASYLAAVWACGEGALLSGLAAAHLFELIKGAPPPPEVTAPTHRRVQGVITHRARRVARETLTYRGVPVTTVPQVLIDLAPRLGLDALARACHEAGVRYRTTPRHVDALLHGQPGAAKLRSILLGDTRVTLSRLEDHFLHLLTEAGLPLPLTNRVASARRVDCRWPEHRLTVELVSYTFHNSRYAWEQDHRREREARQRGDDFRSFTYDDVFDRGAATMAEMRYALSSTRSSTGRASRH